MHGSCGTHYRPACHRYAVAVDWALLRGLAEHAPVEATVREQICAHLRPMGAPLARSLYRVLDCAARPH